jgi:hypothetical protein
LLVFALGLISASARADTDPQAWFGTLTDRVAADLAAGKPLVIQAHVPLCSNEIISCGNKKLGDGNAPDTNLYWITDEGFVGWFGRRGSGWKQVLKGGGAAAGDDDVLEVRVWTRELATPSAWKKRAKGLPAKFSIFVVAFAWRGEAIDRGLAAYWNDLYGTGTRTIELADHTKLVAGGAAQIVSYVGHNRLYDVPEPDWAKLERKDAPVRGTIAIACNTGPFMAQHVPAATRVPLIFTNDFLMASAGAFEGAVLSFASGGDYRAIRVATAHGYAVAGNHDEKKIGGVFTNPSDRRWGKKD